MTKKYYLFVADFCLTPNLRFVCDVCLKSYKHKTNLHRHKKYECQNRGQFNCSLCYRIFDHQHTLKDHFKSCKKKHEIKNIN